MAAPRSATIGAWLALMLVVATRWLLRASARAQEALPTKTGRPLAVSRIDGGLSHLNPPRAASIAAAAGALDSSSMCAYTSRTVCGVSPIQKATLSAL